MWRLKFLLLLVAFSLLTPTGKAQFGASAKEAPHARPRLIADVAAIEPGKSFRLGLHYEIDPNWHIYWINHGDTGLRTKIDWTLPENFSADGLHWPVPERIEQSGLVSYAYENEVVLFTQVKAPAKLDGPNVTFKANSSWLVCSTSCVPGKASLELTLPVGPARPSEEAALFDRYETQTPPGFFAGGTAALPVVNRSSLNIVFDPPSAELQQDGSATIKVTLTPGAGKSFDINANPKNGPTLFPYVPSEFSTEDPRVVERTEQRIVMEWPISARSQAAPGVEILLHAALRMPLSEGPVVASAALPVKVTGETQMAAVSSPANPTFTPETSLPDLALTGLTAPEKTGGNSGQVFSFLTPRKAAEGSLPYFLLLAFIGGLILNVMPCVLPVISLKVLGFVRQSAESPRRRLNLGLMFGVGVLVSFAALAVATILVNAAGRQAGWGFQMTSPRFVIVLATIVLAFALSLFGLFSIELPGRAANAVAQGAHGEGYGGAFMNGVLATLLATPCTAPFLAPAAGFLLQKSPPIILLFFLTVGLGLAMPYVMLAAFPRLLRWLPKPGRWMETLKQLMGFALMGTLVWLLWVLGAQLGNNGVGAVMVYLLLVALACWIVGLPGSLGRRRIALALAALLIFGGYWLPESSLRMMRQAAAVQPAAGPDQIQWEPFSVARVEELAKAGKTIFLDLTADWCVTCKANEKLVLETQGVREALQKNKVVAMRGDWTTGDPTITRVLNHFGSAGVPLYVIFPGKAPEEPIVLPTALTQDLVIKNLTQAAGTTRIAVNSFQR